MTLLDRILRKGVPDDPEPRAPAQESRTTPRRPRPRVVARFHANADEQRRLRDQLGLEEERLVKLDAQIGELEEARTRSVVSARMGDPDPSGTDPEASLIQIERCRRDRADTVNVVAALRDRLDALSKERQALRGEYQRVLGACLDEMFEAHAQAYRKAAGPVIDALLNVAAVQDVMMEMGAGNSNGFSRRAHLPAAEPGEGRTLDPLLSADAGHLRARGGPYRERILAQLKSEGFDWNLK